MKILVINSGSSSIKYRLFDMTQKATLTSGLVERIGLDMSRIKHKYFVDGQEKETIREGEIKNHHQGLEQVANLLMDEEFGVINSPAEIAAVGHRTIHGGESFHQATIMDEAVKDKMAQQVSLAPLHIPATLEGIKVAEQIFSDAVQVGVFDTAFHHTMPPAAYRYALPNWLYEEHRVRAYGFHGTSHLYVSREAALYLGIPLAEINLITAHLGNGASITAVKNGQSIDTSMGFTPLPGLIMGTRVGDVDPGVITFLGNHLDKSFAEVDRLLNKESGLMGICGNSDLRDIEKRQAEGDETAQLALEMYSYRIKKYIGAYMAALGRVDALVFTAGVGENSAYVREQVCQGLQNLGLVLDEEKNKRPGQTIREIQARESGLKVLVIPTNEELEIANQTLAVIQSL